MKKLLFCISVWVFISATLYPTGIYSQNPAEVTAGMDRHGTGGISVVWNSDHLYSIFDVNGTLIPTEILFNNQPIADVQGFYTHSAGFSIVWTSNHVYSLIDINGVLTPAEITFGGNPIPNVKGCYKHSSAFTIMWTDTRVFSVIDINYVLTPAEILFNGISIAGTKGVFKFNAGWSILWTNERVLGLFDINYVITPSEITDGINSITNTKGLFKHDAAWSILWTPNKAYSLFQINNVITPAEIQDNGQPIGGVQCLGSFGGGWSIMLTTNRVYGIYDVNYVLTPYEIQFNGNSISSSRGIYKHGSGWTLLWTPTFVLGLYEVNGVITPTEIFHNGASITGTEGIYRHGGGWDILWTPEKVLSIYDINGVLTTTAITDNGNPITTTQGMYIHGGGWSILWTPAKAYGIYDINSVLTAFEITNGGSSIANVKALFRHLGGYDIMMTPGKLFEAYEDNGSMTTVEITNNSQPMTSYDPDMVNFTQIASVQTVVDYVYYPPDTIIDSFPVWDTTWVPIWDWVAMIQIEIIIEFPEDPPVTLLWNPDSTAAYQDDNLTVYACCGHIMIMTPDTAIIIWGPFVDVDIALPGGIIIHIHVGVVWVWAIVGWNPVLVFNHWEYYEIITPGHTDISSSNGVGTVNDIGTTPVNLTGQPTANIEFTSSSPPYPSSSTGWVVEQYSMSNDLYNYMILGPEPVGGVLEGDAVKLFGRYKRDWGDAPPPYPTLSVNNGACHGNANPGLFLGQLKDFENDGQPNPSATGDNLNGLPDEDGIVFNTPLIPGQVATVTVTAALGGGLLNAWIDFNIDGDWNDAGEQIFINQVLVTGPNILLFSIPFNASQSISYARFRYADVPTLPTGFVLSGEVEDYQVQLCILPVVNCPSPIQVCINANPVVLTGGTPSGGSYGGPGVNNGVFYPAIAGVGLFNLTYTYTDPLSGCYNSCIFPAFVNPLPTVTCNNSTHCLYDPPFVLSGGLPSGGVYYYNGSPVSVFSPQSAGAGVHLVTYTYTDVNGCAGSCIFTITVFAPPVVSCPQNVILCTNGPPYLLAGATPTGGVYKSGGVPLVSFDPASSGLGNYLIKYYYTNPQTGCSDSCSFYINVLPPPQVTCLSSYSVCLSDAPFVLGGCVPAGGIYTENNVVVVVFDPAQEGLGNHSIYYTYVDPLPGCSDITSFLITVYPAQLVTCTGDLSVSITDPPFTLNSCTPSGGIYTGPGVIGNVFSPATAGSGDHTLVYSYSNPNSGCSGTGNFIIHVLNVTYDFGDAPDPLFPTKLVNNGARHLIQPGIYLGNCVDAESTGQPSVLANGDDINLLDDEDGVFINWGGITGSPVNIRVIASVSGFLDAWMDFNNNGSWADAGEQIFTSQPLIAGENILNFVVPAYTINQNNYVRYRFSLEGGLSYTGASPSGEVEDYKYTLTIPSDIKWEQPYSNNLDGIPAYRSGVTDSLVADDWMCFGGDVTNIHWYGSYRLSNGSEIRGDGISSFQIEIHTNNPVNCLPETLPLYTDNPSFIQVNETFTGYYNNEEGAIYEYTYILPYPYEQIPGTRYWIQIMAVPNNLNNPARWKWQEAARSHLPVLCTAAREKVINGFTTGWSSLNWPDEDLHSDMAFTIGGVPIPSLINGTVRYLNAAGTPMTNTKVYLKEGPVKVDSALTNVSGFYELDNVAPGNYNMDGKTTKLWGGVNSGDALTVLKIFVGITPRPQPPSEDTLILYAADVNGDGIINAIDALMISRRFVGIINSFPVGDWLFAKPKLTVTQGNTYPVNFRAICNGDVNKSYLPVVKFSSKVDIVENGLIYTDVGESLLLPFCATEPSLIGAISLVMSYPQEWEILEIQTGNHINDGLSWLAENGILRISWYSLTPMDVEEGDQMFIIRMSIKESLKTGKTFSALNESVLSNEDGLDYRYTVISTPKIVKRTDLHSFQSYCMPNPFTGKTEIMYVLPEDACITLTVTNLLGEVMVKPVDNLMQSAGEYQVNFDCSTCPQGVYSYKLEINTGKDIKVDCRKMILVR
ncbi:MAG: GEVED domain-containing protein [Bacteroidetes bacterium]|nr:GEVED domain-containing protein [Bacteroidota bacterium]